jgi:hypothetical protein
LESFRYEIRVEGVIERTWCDWFEGLELRQEGDQTVMTLTARDTALLHGVLSQIGSLNLKLVSVQRVEAGQGEEI